MWRTLVCILGPLFTWLSAGVLWLGGIHAWAVAAAVIAAITAGVLSWLVYLLVRSTRLGGTAALFVAGFAGLVYAVHPLIQLYDRKYWNPSLVMLLTLVWMYQIQKLKVKNQKNNWIWLGVVFGMALHTHYSVFALLPVTIGVVLFQIQKSRRNIKNASIAIGVFVLFASPLLLFEVRHDWVQARNLYSYITLPDTNVEFEPPTVSLVLGRIQHTLDRMLWIGINKDMAFEYGRCIQQSDSIPYLPFSLVFVCLSIWLWYKHPQYRWFVYVYFGTIVSFVFFLYGFGGRLPEYYLQPVIILTLLLIALSLAKIVEKHSVVGITLGVLALSVWGVQSMTMVNHLGLSTKIRLFELVQVEIGNAPYHLDAVGECFTYEGYRFLAEYAGSKPSSSYMDPYFSWLYGESDGESVVRVVIRSNLDQIGSEDMLKLENDLDFIIDSNQIQAIVLRN
jgi:4-amino-4-deoxy-L-arabinose transferase-like glycosyltransferase